jgi:hypothetical protein
MIVLQDDSLKSVREEFFALQKLEGPKKMKIKWGNREQEFTWVNNIIYIAIQISFFRRSLVGMISRRGAKAQRNTGKGGNGETGEPFSPVHPFTGLYPLRLCASAGGRNFSGQL